MNGGGSANNAKVPLCGSNTTSAQEWKFISVGNGVYQPEPQCAVDKRLDVPAFGTTDGTIVEIYTANGGANQRGKLILKSVPALCQSASSEAKQARTPLEIYPNPATNQTTFRYELSQLTTVHLEVLDALGSRVALLVDGIFQAAGPHQVTFKAQALKNGTHRVALKTDMAVQSRSLLIVH